MFSVALELSVMRNFLNVMVLMVCYTVYEAISLQFSSTFYKLHVLIVYCNTLLYSRLKASI